MTRPRGAAACGHSVTCEAAVDLLAAGGNAFDAAAGALWAACVAEPLLASPGGGGFLLARRGDGDHRLYDFFAHTPLRRRPPEEEAFREVTVDFGPSRQPFHIGLGAAATPGLVAGVFDFHRTLGRMPMREVIQPALAAARTGVRVNRLQAYVASVLAPILTSTHRARDLFAPDYRVLGKGDILHLPELADFLEALAMDGEDLFYRGEFARAVDDACREEGGHLSREDFERYRVVHRDPLQVGYRGRRIWTNSPPASGGLLVAFGLQVLAADAPPDDPRGATEADRIARVLSVMQEARLAEGLAEGVDLDGARRLLDPETVARYRERLVAGPRAPNGTTHISVIDGEGNAAALTVSNGEGCGWVVPGTGVMLNNMLGEADLQPRGFGRWPTDTRLTSMMAPSILEDSGSGRIVAVGSGGSNRIRSAILQVLAGVVDHDLSLSEAVSRPRLHVEGDRLEIEGGVDATVLEVLVERWPHHQTWPELNLFFGGAHAVEVGPDGFGGAGDPRRGGVAMVVPG